MSDAGSHRPDAAAEEHRCARSFRFLVVTQFLTVFNDNAFKQTVLLLALDAAGAFGDPQAEAGFLFAIPFVLFAVLAGDLADRHSKRSVVVAAKWAEAFVMAGATLALYLGHFTLGVVVLFLMGTQSAFLGPAKYGLLPELRPRRLGPANGAFQASVQVGILLGMGSAGFLKQWFRDTLWMAGALFTAVALVGVWVARGIHQVPAADPGRPLRLNPFLRLRAGLRRASDAPGLVPSLFGHAIFQLVGGVILFSWNEMGRTVLYPEEQVWSTHQGGWTARLASLSVTLILGYLLAGRLVQRRRGAGLVALGACGMALGFLLVALGPSDPTAVWLSLLGATFFAGFYLVPLKTWIQGLPAPADKGRILGASQALDWIFIVGASLVKITLTQLGVAADESFLLLAIVMLATAVWIGAMAPGGAGLTVSADSRGPRPGSA